MVWFRPLLLACCLCQAPASGRDWHVHHTLGDDTADGATPLPGENHGPLATIAAAIRQAAPGDTIHLASGLYRQSAVFANKSGAPGQPLTLDGHGAVLTGSDPVPADEIVAAGDGRWRWPRPEMTELATIDGRFVRQGRLSHRRKEPHEFPEVEALQPGQWTWREGAVWVRTDNNAKPQLEVLVRMAGVATSGRTDHIQVRNLVCRHHWNDGFNLHGRGRGMVFENIVAYENIDEGFSAHGYVECVVRNAEFYRCDNGVADINRSQTAYYNTFCHDNESVGFLFPGGRHWVHDSRSENNPRDVVIQAGEQMTDDEDGSHRQVDALAVGDCVFSHFVSVRRSGPIQSFNVTGRCAIYNSTLVDTPVVLERGELTMRWSVLAGPRGAVRFVDRTKGAGRLLLRDNFYQLGQIEVGGSLFGLDRFAEYQQTTGWDLTSVAGDPRLDESGRPAAGSPVLRPARSSGPGYLGAYPTADAVAPGSGVPHERPE